MALLAVVVGAGLPLLTLPEAEAAPGDLATVAGGDGTGMATSIAVKPRGIAVTSDALYIADPESNVIRKVDLATGGATIIAGVSVSGFVGDGAAATSAELATPSDVDVDSDGTIYIADTANNRIRKISPGGIISTFAGNGTAASGGDGATPTAAQIWAPAGVTVAPNGDVFISDTTGGKVRKVTAATGAIGTFATLTSPRGIDTDSAGNVYVATSNHVDRYPAAGGVATIIAGSTTAGSTGDTLVATSALLNTPLGVAVDSSNNVYIGDSANHKVRLVTAATGIISRYAGTGSAGYSGDGGSPISGKVTTPNDVVVAIDGAVYFGQYSATATTPYQSAVRKVASGVISTVAGNGWAAFSGDGGQAANAQLDHPAGLARDAVGNIYVADSYNNRIRRIALDGVITTVAGVGTGCVSACTTAAGVRDGFAATTAYLYRPTNVALDAAGNLYISDTGQNRIRKVDQGTGLISTIAGIGTAGYTADNVPASTTKISLPQGLLVATDGTITIADTGNFRIRQFTVGGDITTIAGIGTAGTIDGAATTVAKFANPTDVQYAADGSLYIADGTGHRVRRLTNGVVSTFAGTGTAGSTGDGGLATAARSSTPGSLAVDSLGNTYVAEIGSGVVRRIDRNNVISTIAGVAGSSAGFTGDGAATSTRMFQPAGLVFNPAGDLYITEQTAMRIRVLKRTTSLATWWTSSYVAGAVGAQYAWDLTRMTTATLGSITMQVPTGTTGTPTIGAVYGVPSGSVQRAGTTLTYSLASPAAVEAGVHIYVRIGGLTNSSTIGTYPGGVTTFTDLGAQVDSVGTNTVTLAASGTALLPATPRNMVMGAPPSTTILAMSPNTPAQADRTLAAAWPIVSTAPRGYTLNVRSTGFTGTYGTLTAATTGVATAVTTASFPTNRIGYTVTMTGAGTTVAALNGKWAGHSPVGENAASASGAAPADTITVSTRAKLDYLTRAGTYTGTVTYTLTPAY